MNMHQAIMPCYLIGLAMSSDSCQHDPIQTRPIATKQGHTADSYKQDMESHNKRSSLCVAHLLVRSKIGTQLRDIAELVHTLWNSVYVSKQCINKYGHTKHCTWYTIVIVYTKMFFVHLMQILI